jgi:hypothetical protein
LRRRGRVCVVDEDEEVVVVVRVVGVDAAVTLRLVFGMPEFAALRPRQGYLCWVRYALLVSDFALKSSNSWKMLGTGSGCNNRGIFNSW